MSCGVDFAAIFRFAYRRFCSSPMRPRRIVSSRGLPQDWGCQRQGIFLGVLFLTGGGRVAWIVRLVKTGAEGEGHCTDVMEIIRPDDLGDIADLGLNSDRSEAVAGRRATGDRRRASQGARGSPAELPVLWRRLPCEGLPGTWRSDAVRPGHGAASAISLCRVWRDRGWHRLAIVLPVDTGAGSASGASLRPDEL